VPAWDAANAAGPPERRGVSPAVLVTAVLLVLAGSGAIAWAALSGKDKNPSYPKTWDARVQPIAHFVEVERNLLFDHPVSVDFIPVDAFKQKVVAGKPLSKAEKQRLADQVAELRAVGLVSGDVDLAKLAKQFVSESVIGYYDPDEKRIFVRGERDTPDVRTTLAHELTHALQDQHYDLRLFRDDTSGRSEGYRALYEADAVRIEDAYAKGALSDSERELFALSRQSASKEADAASETVPAVFADSFSFPYVFGPYLVKALMNNGGNSRVDAAFARPPTTDAEVVSPDLYLTGFIRDEVPTPRMSAGDKAIGEPSSYGQVGFLEVLGARLGYVAAWSAVSGWKGDTSQPYRQKDGKVCVAVASTFRSDPDRDRFEVAARQWASQMPSASVGRADTTVTLRSCDPGKEFKAPIPAPSPFETLIVRNAFAQGLVEGSGLVLKDATCVADRVITQVGPSAISQLNQDQPDPAAVAAVRALAPVAATRCRANPDDRS
jgi:hypothetical protein